MNVRGQLDMNGAIAAVTAGAAACVFFFLILTWLATPGGFGKATGDLEQGVARAEALYRPGRAAAFDGDAVCEEPAGPQGDHLKTRIQDAGAAAGVAVTSIVTGAGVATPGGLTAITVQFQANGRYDQMASLLAQLANGRPEIFVDSADLTSKTSSVDLSFQGRVLCSTVAHP